MFFLFQGVMFRFHIKLLGCTFRYCSVLFNPAWHGKYIIDSSRSMCFSRCLVKKTVVRLDDPREFSQMDNTRLPPENEWLAGTSKGLPFKRTVIFQISNFWMLHGCFREVNKLLQPCKFPAVLQAKFDVSDVSSCQKTVRSENYKKLYSSIFHDRKNMPRVSTHGP